MTRALGSATTVKRTSRAKQMTIAVLWVAIIGGLWSYARSTGDSPIDLAQSFIDSVRGKWWAIALFIAVYAVRPLAVFPATILTVGAGLMFGPFLGVAAAIVGANLSAALTWVIGRSVAGEDPADNDRRDLMHRWAHRLREDSFTTVLVMRFVFLPYDLVGYVSGFLRISFWPFLTATAIGSLPGTIAFVLAGASIDRLDQGVAGISGRIVIVSVVLFAASLGIARVVRRRAESNSVAESPVTENGITSNRPDPFDLSTTTEQVR